MSIFAIADTHLSFGNNKPMDVFSGWENYVVRLEENWKNIVKDEDFVILPGDISWAMHIEEAYQDFKFLHSLPGKKIILKGNHDYWWSTVTKIENFFKEHGFDSLFILHNNAYEIGDFAIAGSRGWFFDDMAENPEKVLLREAGRLRRSLELAQGYNKEILAFLHYPPISTNEVCKEILDVLSSFSVRRCFYGHIHGENTHRYSRLEYEDISFSLVSGDYLKFCPKLIERF